MPSPSQGSHREALPQMGFPSTVANRQRRVFTHTRWFESVMPLPFPSQGSHRERGPAANVFLRWLRIARDGLWRLATVDGAPLHPGVSPSRLFSYFTHTRWSWVRVGVAVAVSIPPGKSERERPCRKWFPSMAANRQRRNLWRFIVVDGGHLHPGASPVREARSKWISLTLMRKSPEGLITL